MKIYNVNEYSNEIYQSKGKTKFFDEVDLRDKAIYIMEKYGRSKNSFDKNLDFISLYNGDLSVDLEKLDNNSVFNKDDIHEDYYQLIRCVLDLEYAYEEGYCNLYEQFKAVNDLIEYLESQKEFKEMSDFKVEITEDNLVAISYLYNNISNSITKQL